MIGSYIRSINKVIKSSIDPKLLLVVASQASGLVNEENKEEAKEEAEETFKLELAYSSIKGS